MSFKGLQRCMMLCCAVLMLSFNAQACDTSDCNNNGDCETFGENSHCKASCKGEWDEDPFTGGTQGCHGSCSCDCYTTGCTLPCDPEGQGCTSVSGSKQPNGASQKPATNNNPQGGSPSNNSRRPLQ